MTFATSKLSSIVSELVISSVAPDAMETLPVPSVPALEDGLVFNT